MSTTANPEAWGRLESMLTAMHTGDVITVDEVVTETGIVVESVEVVLDSLVRAHLFERQGRRFMRVSLFGDAANRRERSALSCATVTAEDEREGEAARVV